MEEDTELCKAKLRYDISRKNKRIAELEKEETEYGRANERKRRKLENQLSAQEEL